MPTAMALRKLPDHSDRYCVQNWLETHVCAKPRPRSCSVRDYFRGNVDEIQEDLCYVSFRGTGEMDDRVQCVRRRGLDYRSCSRDLHTKVWQPIDEILEPYNPEPLRTSSVVHEDSEVKSTLIRRCKLLGAAALGLITLVLRN